MSNILYNNSSNNPSDNIVDHSYETTFNWKEELKKIQNNEIADKLECETNKDICLISYQKLEDDMVTLDCGHKFNYYYILKEYTNQKKMAKHIRKCKYINLYYLEKYCIYFKCPYCRKQQHSMLPFNKKYKTIINLNSRQIYPTNNLYNAKYICFCKYVFEKNTKNHNKNDICNKLILNKNVFCKKHLKTNQYKKYIQDKENKENKKIIENKENKEKEVPKQMHINNKVINGTTTISKNVYLPKYKSIMVITSPTILNWDHTDLLLNNNCQWIFKKGKNKNKKCNIQTFCKIKINNTNKRFYVCKCHYKYILKKYTILDK